MFGDTAHQVFLTRNSPQLHFKVFGKAFVSTAESLDRGNGRYHFLRAIQSLMSRNRAANARTASGFTFVRVFRLEFSWPPATHVLRIRLMSLPDPRGPRLGMSLPKNGPPTHGAVVLLHDRQS